MKQVLSTVAFQTRLSCSEKKSFHPFFRQKYQNIEYLKQMLDQRLNCGKLQPSNTKISKIAAGELTET